MTSPRTRGRLSGNYELAAAVLFAVLAVATALYVRIRLLDMPLERDEGEYAYSGALILKGYAPYLHAYTMKLPGMAYLSALFMFCFGKSVQGLHVGLVTANLLSTAMVCRIGATISGKTSGALAAGVFALLTVSHHLLGTFSHATHFIVLFLLVAILLTTGSNRTFARSRYLAAGFSLGLAFLVKQHASIFMVALFIFIAFDRENSKQRAARGLHLLAGFITPCLITLLTIMLQGNFSSFWFWTVSYASTYASELTLLLGWMNFKSQVREILNSALIYWLLAGTGFLLLIFRPAERAAVLLAPLACCSLLAIAPGFYFRPHYFILLTPAISLLAASLASERLNFRGFRMGVIIATFFAALLQLWQEKWFLFAAPPEEYLKKAYQTTKPFVESAVIADYIRKTTSKKDRILVLGSEPQIYFYSDRLSATGHIYMYPLMEEQPYALKMQAEMLRQIEASRPVCVILVDDLSSWLAVSKEGTLLREKLGELVKNRYELDGVAAVSREDQSFYVFGERARQFIPSSRSRILLYRLKGGE